MANNKRNASKSALKQTPKAKGVPQIPMPTPAEKPVIQKAKKRPMLRAIEVTADMLVAVKAYRKATKISLYQLGKEAVAERLIREGYLKPPTADPEDISVTPK